MTGSLYLAWRYLAYHKVKTVLLVSSITLVLFIPSALNILVRESEVQLRSRSQSTPLLIGASGSPLELVLNSLYFRSEVPDRLPYQEVVTIRQSGLATAIPLYVRFRARQVPIVATTLDYLEFRNLTVARGTSLRRLGDCLLGAKVADQLKLQPGDTVTSSPESVFDLAGVYPLKMRITGILAPSGSADDHAILTDIKTGWVMEGLAHGHDDLEEPDMKQGVLRREGNRIVANASVRQFNQITDDNIDSFHFHGDQAQFPITAVIAVPGNQKQSALLQGRYLKENAPAQIVRPGEVIEDLLETVFAIRRYVLLALAGVGAGTVATAILVFLLSWRLRQREFETLIKIGGGRFRIALLGITEVLLVAVASLLLSMLLTSLVQALGPHLVRMTIR